jgi:hypothetical protein
MAHIRPQRTVAINRTSLQTVDVFVVPGFLKIQRKFFLEAI